MRFFPLMLKLSKQETIIVNNLLHISGADPEKSERGGGGGGGGAPPKSAHAI